MGDADIAEALCAVARLFGERRWCLATSGNFSARTGAGEFLISESGRDKSRLGVGDLLACDAEGRPLDSSRRPSAETPLHALLYRRDPNVGAVLHTHSVAATVLSRAADRHVTLRGFEMQKALAGVATHETGVSVPVFDNDQDMRALAAVVTAYLDEGAAVPGFLIRGHGLYAWGEDIAAAQRHAEGLEFVFACMLEEQGRMPS